ncbi:hypothetical protein GCM10009841_14520 [Microlunatus panaciterrae]|uniref:AraC-like DNA-binding protein n=1 Tax=Microlunatus panaciterrae TaxID=400768 RepID=A0ABS2RLZ4_9ACTN|nr:AraC family transcriptional regulator [Microlunatus panaciterrae]MBM7800012.1 AraC-like DNA-binding protein [Microlunatus panaciterrae]
MQVAADHRLALRLARPPEVRGIGIGVHGTRHRHERWVLPELHSLHLYGYDGVVTLDGVLHRIRPGHASLVPPGAVMEFQFRGPSEHLFAHLLMPRSGPTRDVPVMQDLGVDGPVLQERLRSARHLLEPDHLAAEVWSVLWSLATLEQRRGSQADGEHPALRAAVRHVEGHLADRLTVPEIAAATGYSASHLNRLFGSAMGCSVTAYVRRRRMARARHLLQDTTQSISSVAASVGIADLQAFNKACRREFGAPPRALRSGS